MGKYKVGDKVRIKSLDWYNSNKDEYGTVQISPNFIEEMSRYCGQIMTISHISEPYDFYELKEDFCSWSWSDEFFEDEPFSGELTSGMDLNN